MDAQDTATLVHGPGSAEFAAAAREIPMPPRSAGADPSDPPRPEGQGPLPEDAGAAPAGPAPAGGSDASFGDVEAVPAASQRAGSSGQDELDYSAVPTEMWQWAIQEFLREWGREDYQYQVGITETNLVIAAMATEDDQAIGSSILSLLEVSGIDGAIAPSRA